MKQKVFIIFSILFFLVGLLFPIFHTLDIIDTFIFRIFIYIAIELVFSIPLIISISYITKKVKDKQHIED